MIAAGTDPRGALIYACGVMLVGMFFAAVGTGCAQLVDQRRTASGIAAGVLVLGMLLRMVADGSEALAGLIWLTPFGLLAEAQPYAANRLLPLLVLAAGVIAAGVLAVAARLAGTWVRGWSPNATGGAAVPAASLGARVRDPADAAGDRGLGYRAGCVLRFDRGAGAIADRVLSAGTRFADLAAQAGFADLATVQDTWRHCSHGWPSLGDLRCQSAGRRCRDEAEGRLTRSWPCRYPLGLGPHPPGSADRRLRRAGLDHWSGHLDRHQVGRAGLRLTEALSGTVNVVPVALLCLAAAQTAVGWARGRFCRSGPGPSAAFCSGPDPALLMAGVGGPTVPLRPSRAGPG